MLSKKNPRSYTFVFLLIFSLLLGGCTQATAEPTDTAAQQETQAEETQPETPDQEEPTQPLAEGEETIAVYATTTTYPNLDPSASASNENIVLANVYELLVYVNPPDSEEILRPGLAESWESDEEGTEWTFHLRDGVKFHDGAELNAAAVKFSIERTMEKGEGFAYIWDPVEEIVVVDDLTVRFELSQPAPLDLIAASQYASWIFSPKSVEGKTSDWFNEGNAAGTGPYRMESYQPGQRMILDRFEDYWGGWEEGQLDRVLFEPVEDPTVRQQMITAGEADITKKVPRENLDSLNELPGLTVYSSPSFTNLQGLLNTQKPPLDNVLVRRALSYTFPYQIVVENVMLGYAEKAHGPVPAGLWGHNDDLFQYSLDLDKAQELLEEAGHPDGGFDLLLTYATGDLDEQQLAELWKAELAKLNINLEIQGMAWETQWDLAKTGKESPEKAQDIIVWYWWPDVLTPYSMLYGQLHCGEDVVYNMAYYCNPELDKLMDEANELTVVDREEAEELFVEAQKLIIDEAPMIFMYDLENTMIFNSDLKGFVDNPAYAEVVFFHQLTR